VERGAGQVAEAPPAVELAGIRKAYGHVQALDDVSLTVGRGESFALVGPSGCGKTTSLGVIAGFVEPDAGDVRLGGRRVNDVPDHARGTAMVFQNYALFPHLTVFENVAFGLRVRRVVPGEIARRVSGALETVRLAGREAALPRQLSGGQQQRVALARALVIEPPVLLLDEPMSNLDARLRESVRHELKEILRRLDVTAIFVTHDIQEAFVLSDRVAVMHQGRIEQIGTPVQLYERPATTFVADFVGPCNLLDARVVEARGEQLAVHLEGAGVVPALARRPATAGQAAVLVVRPERIRVCGERPAEPIALEGKVVRSSYLGAQVDYLVELEGVTVRASAPSESHLARQPGERVWITWKMADGDCHLR
jgi:ABC-type Fe3+/spermidine/putrescine transport system ATPase subunit